MKFLQQIDIASEDKSLQDKKEEISRVAIIGNPNSGKTALFNRLYSQNNITTTTRAKKPSLFKSQGKTTIFK
jgi:Fe2+ transport system protein B